jgi:alcohol dehydrogenase
MRAAVLHEFGKPPTVETLTDPVPGPGEVVVDVAAAAILPYANEVFDGTRRYLLDLPVVPGPGAIGRVRATGPDIGGLAPGDWVTCDPTLRSRDGAPTPEIMLQGWSARAQGGLRLQRRFGNGSYAEQMLTPRRERLPDRRDRPGRGRPLVRAAAAGRGPGTGPGGGADRTRIRPGRLDGRHP